MGRIQIGRKENRISSLVLGSFCRLCAVLKVYGGVHACGYGRVFKCVRVCMKSVQHFPLAGAFGRQILLRPFEPYTMLHENVK